MKFCKKYEEYMQGQDHQKLPGVGFKKLKKILKKCRKEDQENTHKLHLQNLSLESRANSSHQLHDSSSCPDHCSVCDGTFFPSLLSEMSAVVGSFNERAQKLLELHLASGVHKCFIWFKDKLQGNHVALIEEGKDLVSYALINAIAMRKILKKYDKIHYSNQGQAFKSQVQSMHIEILQSPWLCELMAFHINLRETKTKKRNAPDFFDGCSLVFNDGKPSLSFHLLDSVKMDIDLTCPICLAASVTIVDGLKEAKTREKCALCREAGVYEGAVHLEELNILLSRSCPEYWEERRQSERVERTKQAKEHWESQCRLFTGV
ncbi:putative E3 ubiquitin-protein ligase BAH1-like 1 isoform X2 [Apium graveolens]|uniref:putative E3 ubiquitin-protein ligase BAH1-like 1 isoform X2 n=1 Tax=Apium graveolens TaxID=4045 RepID=UPI003D7BA1D5